MIDVFKISHYEFVVLVPYIVEEKNFSKLKADIEDYLINSGYNHFFCEMEDNKFMGKWRTEFVLKFLGGKVPEKSAIEATFKLFWKGEFNVSR